MNTTRFSTLASLVLGFAVFTAGPGGNAAPPQHVLLTNAWSLQSSAKVPEGGEVVSQPGYVAAGWYAATVPSTVVGNLVDDGVYPDPFFGTNLMSLPGMNYPIGENFSNLPMPPDSPFTVSWWYRREFRVTAPLGAQVWLDFEGINYRANIWLNGKRIADARDVAGAYRRYTFNITGAVRVGQVNALAVEIFPPGVDDLAITWVDWNPTPPDKCMGLWREVAVRTTGPVALRDPQIVTRLDQPGLDRAHLTVSAELHNASRQPATATIKGTIDTITFEKTLALAAQETKSVTFSPEEFPQLNLEQPRLWWPTHVGPQNLYPLDLQVVVNGETSDADSLRFGVREVTSELNDKGYRVFKINGRPILIRGGGWAPDMFLRSSAGREADEIRYVKDMNLNTIRFEGKTESRRFLELCDREGIMVIAGWCCCDHWEKWDRWSEEDYRISAQSLRDQVRRLRNHPCVITWWYGSDNPPNARAEKNYLDVFKELNWPNPVQASATAKTPKVGEPTGLRMTGPYEYVPPVYWYVDTNAGGAYSFNTETSPGPAVPPIESLRRMLPPDHLWPIDSVWTFHAGGGPFHSLAIFTDALDQRLGAAAGVEDYARKAQLIAYDGERAMFEAYARNKYTSTGVIQWMMNNAWPSMIWHLYDYYLRPGGGYFGTKKACEPVHIQYSYDDRSVVVVNGLYRGFQGLEATAEVYNLDLTGESSQRAVLDLEPDSVRRAFTLPDPTNRTSTYFLRLALRDRDGKLVSSNFYWLSTRPETLNESKATWYYTPTRDFADLKALATLAPAQVKVSANSRTEGANEITRVTVENAGTGLAFLLHLKINRGETGDEILPVIWEDNYFALMPGERRELQATYAAHPLAGQSPVVELEGWNVKALRTPARR